MKNKIDYIRKELERLIKEQREQFQSEIDSYTKTELIKLTRSKEHEYFVNGIDESYKLICQVFNERYDPIRSELKIE
jgi:ribosomal protein S2